jgi:hypothetical protein
MTSETKGFTQSIPYLAILANIRYVVEITLRIGIGQIEGTREIGIADSQK